MMVTAISSFVFAGVLSAYTFLGRGLTRQGNAEMLESRTRLALYYFTQDVSAATDVTNAASTQLSLDTPTTVGVTYTYTAGAGPATGVLNRQTAAVGPPGIDLLTGLSSFSFNYYNFAGAASSGTSMVKQVNMAYTSVAGSPLSGAQSHFNVVSPRVIMKNKPILQ